MPLNKLEMDTIKKGFASARIVLETVRPLVDALNIIYDSAGGVKETVTQEDLDEVAEFSGLTKQQLDDGMYALTSAIRTDIEDAKASLSQLAARAV